MTRALDPVDRALLQTEVQTADLSQLHQRLQRLTDEVSDAAKRTDLGLDQLKAQQHIEDQRPRFRPLLPTLDTTINETKSLLAALERCREFMAD